MFARQLYQIGITTAGSVDLQSEAALLLGCPKHSTCKITGLKYLEVDVARGPVPEVKPLENWQPMKKRADTVCAFGAVSAAWWFPGMVAP